MQTISRKTSRKSQRRTVENILDALSLHDQIETRAYHIYVARGGEPGRDLEDWLQAEREIMGWS